MTLDERALEVYPAMLIKPKHGNTIFISDFEAKYSRAYAADNIKAVDVDDVKIFRCGAENTRETPQSIFCRAPYICSAPIGAGQAVLRPPGGGPPTAES